MDLHGSLASNLQMAIESSKRLQGHPVHRDTLLFWVELIGEARARRAAGDDPHDPDIERLIAELETAIAKIQANSSL